MRICLVVPGGVDRSGTERVIPALLWLLERLARRHDVVVLSLGQEREPSSWPLLGARVVDLGLLVPSALPGLAILRRRREASRFFRNEERGGGAPFDLVHAFWASPCGFLAAVSRRRGAPLVVSLAGGELAGIPSIGYGHQLHGRERAKVAYALSRASAVTAASLPMVRAAEAAGVPARLVPLGPPAEAFVTRERRSGPDAPFRLVQVADLNAVKDQGTLLRAVALARREDPSIVLDVAGEDTLGGAVPREAARLGLDRDGAVAFHGRLAQDGVRALLARSDLFVLSSLHEAGPVAVVEAAAAGLATVGTAVGHVAEGDGGRSLAVPPGDERALAAAILALRRDPGRLRRMEEAALAWARANDADATARRFEAIYAEVAKTGAEGPRAAAATGP